MMTTRRMWGIIAITFLIEFIGLFMAGLTEINFNIYANHHLLGQVEPGVMRLIFAVWLIILAKRIWHVKLHWHGLQGISYLWRVGWLVLLIALINMTVASDSIVWHSFQHGMNFTNIWTLFSVSLVEAAFVGIFEEVIARGIMMGSMLQTFQQAPVLKSILFSSMIFGGTHMINYLSAPFWDTTNQIIYATGIGIILATIYYLSHNLWIPIILHATMDFTAFVFALHSMYVNQAGTYGIDLFSLGILLLAIVISYGSLLINNRRSGHHDWIF
jgi:uncharacterized protein